LLDPVWIDILAEPICHRVKEDPGRGLAALPVDLLEPIRVKSGPKGIVYRIAKAAFEPPGHAGRVAVVPADFWVAEVAAAGDRVDGYVGPIDFCPGHSGHRPQFPHEVCRLGHFRDRIVAPFFSEQLQSGFKLQMMHGNDDRRIADLSDEKEVP